MKINMKKIAVLGGGTGMSQLLTGLKKLPFDISSIVAVSDDGKSTGRLRKEFNIPAIGDLRKVLIALSENEELTEKLLGYRFSTKNDLDGHPIGNLLLAALTDINGNLSDGIADLDDILRLKGKVIPLTEDNVTLMGEMEDGKIVRGEHNITEDKRNIKRVFYEKNPEVTIETLKAIEKADAIILSMGSLYTSIIPNLICPEVKKEIDKSKAKIIYVCNMMTQPGETDNFTVSDHIKKLNEYLGKRKVDTVIVNDAIISDEKIDQYKTAEQKSPVVLDEEKLKKMKVTIIRDNLIDHDCKYLRHNSVKVALNILSYLID
jgi:uncharacterized cofD-like protein